MTPICCQVIRAEQKDSSASWFCGFLIGPADQQPPVAVYPRVNALDNPPPAR